MDDEKTCGHFQSHLYSDGSGPSFVMLKAGTKYHGINERLREAYKRWGKHYIGYKGAILHCENATTLEYRRGCNDEKYLVIHGDLGRAHYPQPWAKGTLPAISMSRLRAWWDTSDESFFMFQMPRGHLQQVSLAADYMVLLIVGWGCSFCGDANTSADFHKILKGVGFNLVTRRDVSNIIIHLGSVMKNPNSPFGGHFGKDHIDAACKEFEKHATRTSVVVKNTLKTIKANPRPNNMGFFPDEFEVRDGHNLYRMGAPRPSAWAPYAKLLEG